MSSGEEDDAAEQPDESVRGIRLLMLETDRLPAEEDQDNALGRPIPLLAW